MTTQQEKLPVIKRYDQLLRAKQRRENRSSLESATFVKPAPENDALRMFTVSSLRNNERACRRRTFDGPLSPSSRNQNVVLPELRTSTATTQSAPTSRHWSPLTSPEIEKKTNATEQPLSVKSLKTAEVSLEPLPRETMLHLFARVVRCVGSFLLALRRARSVVRIRRFLQVRDATSRRRVLSQKIKRVIGMVVHIQRVWRSAVVCKRAKMQVVMDLWDEEERVVVRALVQAGHRARRSVYGRQPEHRNATRLIDTRRRVMERDESTGGWCTVDLHRRWELVQERFREFDNKQMAVAKSMMLPKKVKTHFARKYVEAARKAHLTFIADQVKEEVARLRLRVLYTTEDAKHLLEAGDSGADSSVDRLRMRLILQNMTSSAALSTYCHLKDQTLSREGSQGSPQDPTAENDLALMLGDFRERLPTFLFFQRLCTRAQKGYIQTAVRAAHNCDRRTL